jgi:hypothetical protein
MLSSNICNEAIPKFDLLSNQGKQGSFHSVIPKTWSQVFIFLLIFLNAGIFSATSSNPLGIKGASEFLELLFVSFSFGYLVTQIYSKGTVSKIDLTVFALIFTAFFYSALAAHLRFGQPIIYGLIEERRLLNVLVYFPIAWGIRRGVVSTDQIISWIIGFALLCGVLSILVVLGVIAPLSVIEVSANALREERYGIGSAYIALASLLLLSKVVYYKRRVLFFQLLFLVLVLLAVVQTRQIVIAVMVSSIFLLGMTRFAIWSTIAAVVFAALATSTDMVSSLILKYQALFFQLGSEEYLEASARALTINSIVNQIMNGAWMGSGALSSLWKNGFARIYGESFYLTDVGFLGSLYKFGVLAVALYGIYFSLQYKLLRNAKDHPYHRLLMAVWVYLLVILPVAATLEYRGSISGLLLAVSLGCAIEVARARKRY